LTVEGKMEVGAGGLPVAEFWKRVAAGEAAQGK